MKIQFMSDLHCEMYIDGGLRMLDELPVIGDVLVVAGDLAPHQHLVQAVDWLCSKFPHVIYVTGNHEYYFSDRGTVNNDIVKLKARFQNFHPLNKETVTIGGQRFVGATGWYPNQPDNWCYEQYLNDFRLIAGYKKWVYEVHNEHRKFFLDTVQPEDVVVTHHAPLHTSTPDRFKDSKFNRFYISQFADVITNCQPKLWFHGHMHDPSDYMAMNTRILANPKGYPRENTGFDAQRIVEV